MRNLIGASLLCLAFLSNAQDDYRVIPSVSDWIEEINNWPDSIYQVEDIMVLIDLEKDSLVVEDFFVSGRRDTLEEIAATIDKPLHVTRLLLDNIFEGGRRAYSLKNILFKESVRLYEYQGLVLHASNLIFEKRFSISKQFRHSYFNFFNCEFKDEMGLYDIEESSYFQFRTSLIHLLYAVRTPGKPSFRIVKCEIARIGLRAHLDEIEIRDSNIEDVGLQGANIESRVHVLETDIQSIGVSETKLPVSSTYIPFEQISEKIYVEVFIPFTANSVKYFLTDTLDFSLHEEYDMLIASYKSLLTGYQNRGDYDSYNACFVEMRNVETRRLGFRYKENPSFKGFFTWKINQFLKTFSAYGTEPARAIIFSLYVILIFAAIYLFFPNSWDAHGRTRIMDRYRFFLKYLNRKEGASEVYQEEKEKELLPFHEFKNYLEENGKTAPRFFYATALPLYKWSISGSRLSGWFLSKIDVLNGKWSEVPEDGRWLKSGLVIGAFLIALLCDLLIKVLNAVMLSINTFTTLGFGEIPIKGLPRYLAIVQGFIGWFMLTIFSVSLISQLLN